MNLYFFFFFFSSRRRHTRYWRDWSSDVCSSDLALHLEGRERRLLRRIGVRALDFELDLHQVLLQERGLERVRLQASRGRVVREVELHAALEAPGPQLQREGLHVARGDGVRGAARRQGDGHHQPVVEAAGLHGSSSTRTWALRVSKRSFSLRRSPATTPVRPKCSHSPASRPRSVSSTSDRRGSYRAISSRSSPVSDSTSSRVPYFSVYSPRPKSRRKKPYPALVFSTASRLRSTCSSSLEPLRPGARLSPRTANLSRKEARPMSGPAPEEGHLGALERRGGVEGQAVLAQRELPFLALDQLVPVNLRPQRVREGRVGHVVEGDALEGHAAHRGQARGPRQLHAVHRQRLAGQAALDEQVQLSALPDLGRQRGEDELAVARREGAVRGAGGLRLERAREQLHPAEEPLARGLVLVGGQRLVGHQLKIAARLEVQAAQRIEEGIRVRGDMAVHVLQQGLQPLHLAQRAAGIAQPVRAQVAVGEPGDELQPRLLQERFQPLQQGPEERVGADEQQRRNQVLRQPPHAL